MIDLSEREKKLLKLIIEDFVESAMPISSRTLCKKHELKLSSATVRNVMMDLEEKGLLCQPHISAGRIPTDQGYRVHVDQLMSINPLARAERRNVLDKLRRFSRSFDHVLETASQVLGEISHQLGIVFLPRYYDGVFDRLELVPITSNRTLLVINIKSGLVKTIMLEMDFEISRDILETTSNILNERLHGLQLSEIKQSIDARLRHVSGGHPSLIRYFQSSANEVFDFEDWEDFYFGGARNILRQPEFVESSRFDNLMGVLENKHNMIQFFESISDNRPFKISIGRENAARNLESCSVVASDYLIGNVRGLIGVIGPTRMDYGRMVSIVNYMSHAISSFAED